MACCLPSLLVMQRRKPLCHSLSASLSRWVSAATMSGKGGKRRQREARRGKGRQGRQREAKGLKGGKGRQREAREVKGFLQ